MDGRALIPAEQFVLKVHSRCDLACDHCYVYESIDQSWRGRPVVMSPDVVSRTAMRIAEHVKAHELGRVEIVLHGGEPLLAGVTGLRAILVELERALGDRCRLDVKVQAEAAERYEHVRAHTAAAVETLVNSGSLTPLGLQFASGMRIAIPAHGYRP